jgi:hypothetical protein
MKHGRGGGLAHVSELVPPETEGLQSSGRLTRKIAAVDLHYLLLTPVAQPMQMPGSRARRRFG